ncbi:hypothetical protein DBT_0888 [Dissulfuribacter thermophilus]|uniref:Uncharacterized protein n=1 Tax=Dissulfuribacter thermophilus TaxID=1156395 RepID=A0A1B9F6H2_9BACT|nr:hypothetical protein DBT_0888 [Dissulfuribacter thermophilus]
MLRQERSRVYFNWIFIDFDWKAGLCACFPFIVGFSSKLNTQNLKKSHVSCVAKCQVLSGA